MTEKANPSVTRPAEAFKTAGAIAYGGHGGDGFIVDGASPTQNSVQDADIKEGNLNAFVESHSASSFDVTIDPGEAFVYGSWLAIDVSTTVTLASSTAGQTVYVGWNKDGSDDVIIGRSSDFAAASGDTDQKIPIWDFDTDGSGVTSSTDRRTIGYTQSDTTVDGTLDVTGATNLSNTLDVTGQITAQSDIVIGNTTIGSNGIVTLEDRSGGGNNFRIFERGDGSGLDIDWNSQALIRIGEGGPVEVLNTDFDIASTNRVRFGNSYNFRYRNSPDSLTLYKGANDGTQLVDIDTSAITVTSTILDLSSTDRFSLPAVSSDPSAGAGDMWYRSDLD